MMASTLVFVMFLVGSGGRPEASAPPAPQYVAITPSDLGINTGAAVPRTGATELAEPQDGEPQMSYAAPAPIAAHNEPAPDAPAEEVPPNEAASVDIAPQQLAVLIGRVASQLSVDSSLTPSGIILFTNTKRMLQGLPPLRRNARLDAVAAAKLDDLFARQYFAHESPDGRDVVDLAMGAGYQYHTLGENLALGDFDDADAVVEIWMDSVPHRANILNPEFTEIGAAARYGKYQQWNTWIVVQEFGAPCHVCDGAENVSAAPQDTVAAVGEIYGGWQMLGALGRSLFREIIEFFAR